MMTSKKKKKKKEDFGKISHAQLDQMQLILSSNNAEM